MLYGKKFSTGGSSTQRSCPQYVVPDFVLMSADPTIKRKSQAAMIEAVVRAYFRDTLNPSDD